MISLVHKLGVYLESLVKIEPSYRFNSSVIYP